MSEKGKEAGIAVTAEELACINRFAKKELRAEEVYTFAVKLCDNEVDRDFERFDRAALEKLSELFVGRTGIFDHSWSAGGQTARIYRAEVIEEETRTTAGDKYCWCKGWAYMLRTEKNAELIAEIEGGIKKEVSVGCSAAKRSCSICGKDAGLCEHERGKYYGGKLCYAVLSDITDAYEWSFVAVERRAWSSASGRARARSRRWCARAAAARRYASWRSWRSSPRWGKAISARCGAR